MSCAENEYSVTLYERTDGWHFWIMRPDGEIMTWLTVYGELESCGPYGTRRRALKKARRAIKRRERGVEQAQKNAQKNAQMGARREVVCVKP